ncbi:MULTISPECIES: aliphatic sulfonate ABC transporter substrate-binding protein [Rhizobium/Agrobacterium group]|jgi:sulfonate transport system substrate-binding protein|uniref:Putative aliphatic sulfonates-binding protein n=1 Tax=Agrobacterium tumefaciens TaxID=358 RepID=A0AA86G0L9_AGRTU|nr:MULTISPECIES: aliphatic sulfonate ABC transporter substrate-binding protein [Rhizobium/Agrobacterium group]AHK03950.1 alkanesulfonates-binding protein [Agrobacterium tumefaciens LBA4213 (Ach5)]AKC09700.1 sulfonate transport system substrate-binding protein [Agrobacterium tumefaciens]AYM13547.1 sulfonate transport system substrate-binding protein [Agrobacterium tumefaciens]AYM18844.1 sulfonate transport system substrate-binding protein [Agrobacterium tumefaciens]AYM70143.1 sulfonate transpor
MPAITRRALSASFLVVAALSVLPLQAQAAEELKIGYQKTGLPVIARQQGVIEKALEAKGVKVSWVEFTAGPPLVEALNVGSINVGWTGDAPPIFGQAAGSAIVYVAALPSNGKGEAIFTKPESGIKSVADLKGKKVGVGKGTSAHNLLVAAIEKNGLKFSDIDVVYLSPADAAAAFASDKIDAWAVWDPFYAIAETRYKPVTLARTSEVLNVSTYFLANRDYAKSHADTINITLDALGEAAKWSAANRDKVAAALHEVTGVPLEAQTLAANRSEFGISKIDDKIIASQQETADRFYRLGLIPKQISIKDAVWSGATN